MKYSSSVYYAERRMLFLQQEIQAFYIQMSRTLYIKCNVLMYVNFFITQYAEWEIHVNICLFHVNFYRKVTKILIKSNIYFS